MENSKNEDGQEPNENLDRSEDEIRSSVVEQYKLNSEEQSELIDSLVTDKLEDQKKLSTAIRQKRDWREKAEKPAEVQTDKKEEDIPQTPKTDFNEEDILKKMEASVEAKFAEKELNSLGLSDELKKEVKSFAKVNDVSINEAMESSYVQFRKSEEEEKVEAEDASISPSHKSAKLDYSKAKLSDFDLTTEDGQAGFKKCEEHIREQLG